MAAVNRQILTLIHFIWWVHTGLCDKCPRVLSYYNRYVKIFPLLSGCELAVSPLTIAILYLILYLLYLYR
jgi:hypothetical protein